MCEPRAFEFEMIIEMLNRHKSQSTDQIAADIINADGTKILSEVI